MNIRKGSRIWAVIVLLAAFGAAPAALRADGFIIPRPGPREVIPPLTVKYHRVAVEITDQAARTSVDQVFVNNFDRDIEGTYIFPLPEGAALSEFAMWIGEEKVTGQILDSVQARRIYEDIVRRMRDPGLLEYAGRGLFQARVYPIPARGEKRVRISYVQVLKAEKGLVKYLYPLNTERFSRDPLGDVSVSVHLEAGSPILNVYSPSHRVSVRREREREARIGYEDKNIRPDKDFVLYYSLSRDDVGLSWLGYRGEDGGTFLLLASPRYAAERERVMNKNLVLVLDSSGSMSGNKIRQAKDAARFILNHLEEGDRFSIVDFDDGITALSETLLPASSANRDRALKFVDDIQDSGGTNINDALLKALKMAESGGRPNYILFLTDGLPTVGITGTAEILKNLAGGNDAKARVFVFGVGNDVNTELLDRISTDHRGASVYVSAGEDLEVAISGYYEKIASPLLSDLSLSIEGLETSQIYPRSLPDLFKGSQIVVVGRFKGEGPATVVLTGRVGKETKRYVLEEARSVRDEAFNFLPRLWATRRVGFLLEEIRLRGANPELVDEIKALGLKYGIVTPYTSYLVTEAESRNIAAAAPAAQEAMRDRQVSGAGAVQVAKTTAAIKGADRAETVVSSRIKYLADKTFYLQDGVWTDSVYKEGLAVKEVVFSSDAYYRLLAEKPGLGKYLSAGSRVVVVFEGTAYKVTDSADH